METEFTPVLSLIGGVTIGLAATFFMALHGRIAGMTGILGGLIPPFASDWKLRVAFLAGAILAPALMLMAGQAVPFATSTPLPLLIIGGFIVGVGVLFGSGCTSGHGVCGLARLSPRSAAATATFMATTFITVFVVRHVLGL